MRRAPGATSCRIPTSLPTTSSCWLVNPVMLPPGLARLATNPAPTASETPAMTMGAVFEARCAARAACWLESTITSAFCASSSRARMSRRSTEPSAEATRYSTFFPSNQPRSRMPWANAARSWAPAACEVNCSIPTRRMVGAGWPWPSRYAASRPMPPASRTLRRVITDSLRRREGVQPSYADRANRVLPATDRPCPLWRPRNDWRRATPPWPRSGMPERCRLATTPGRYAASSAGTWPLPLPPTTTRVTECPTTPQTTSTSTASTTRS